MAKLSVKKEHLNYLDTMTSDTKTVTKVLHGIIEGHIKNNNPKYCTIAM